MSQISYSPTHDVKFNEHWPMVKAHYDSLCPIYRSEIDIAAKNLAEVIRQAGQRTSEISTMIILYHIGCLMRSYDQPVLDRLIVLSNDSIAFGSKKSRLRLDRNEVWFRIFINDEYVCSVPLMARNQEILSQLRKVRLESVEELLNMVRVIDLGRAKLVDLMPTWERSSAWRKLQ